MRRILAILNLLLLIACSEELIEIEIKEIDEAYALWKSYGITSYTITQARNCFYVDGGTKMQIIVREGAIVSVSKKSDGTAIPEDRWKWYKTIDQLFETAVNAKNNKPASFTIEFDSKYGFISSFWVDPIEYAADDEYGYDIEGFQPVK